MPEKEITRRITKLIKDLDKLVQDAEQAVEDLKKLGNGKDADKT